MKKYLVIGLLIIIGSNLALLSRVAQNRSGEVTSELLLTERELSLPRNYGLAQENSGITLSLNWRTPSVEESISYNRRELVISEEDLLSLGFNRHDDDKSHWSEPVELYWAFEFDGDLYKAELSKAALAYKEALLASKKEPNDENKRLVEQANKILTKERNTRSRLIFVEAATSYEELTAKFPTNKKRLIVKGLARTYFNSKNNSHRLTLDSLSTPNIMVPLAHNTIFIGLKKRDWQDITPPRYALNIQWGSTLEPWVTSVTTLTR